MFTCTQVASAYQAVLRAFPGIRTSGDADGPPPGVLRSAWGTDPLFRGSYSYISARATADDVHALSAPVTCRRSACQSAPGKPSSPVRGSGNAALPERETQAEHGQEEMHGGGLGAAVPVLLFAGEATHVEHIGTTHAAVRTGRQQARNLLQAYA